MLTRVLATAVVMALALAVPAPASASQGSIPAEVADYAATDLVPTLERFVGVGADGKGIDFDDTTEVGPLNRVHLFTEEWTAGVPTDLPVELANQWTAPITVRGNPLGLATIWINPDTEAPELADFTRDSSLATALADVPADATLIRDEPRAAWLTLVGTELTAPVAGHSGIDGSLPLADYQRFVQDSTVGTAPPGEWFNLGSALSIATIAVAALLILLALLFPLLRAQRRARSDAPDLHADAP